MAVVPGQQRCGARWVAGMNVPPRPCGAVARHASLLQACTGRPRAHDKRMTERPIMNKPSRAFAKPLRELLGKVVGDTFKRQGFASAELVTRWTEIVGAEIAAYSEPIKLQWPRPPAPRCERRAPSRPDPGWSARPAPSFCASRGRRRSKSSTSPTSSASASTASSAGARSSASRCAKPRCGAPRANPARRSIRPQRP